MYVQNDQRVMGIILRYVCWGTHCPPPPPPARGPWWLTARPAYPLGLGKRRGGGVPPNPLGWDPPPLQPLKWFNTPQGHIPPGSHPRAPGTPSEPGTSEHWKWTPRIFRTSICSQRIFYSCRAAAASEEACIDMCQCTCVLLVPAGTEGKCKRPPSVQHCTSCLQSCSCFGRVAAPIKHIL